MEQSFSAFLECSYKQHGSCGSPHPKARVPRELFVKESNKTLLRMCLHCRTYKNKGHARRMEKKRKGVEGAEGEFKCVHCSSMRSASICERCTENGIKGAKAVRESYARVILERVAEMGNCCVDCKKVFLKNPTGVGFLTVDSLEGINLDEIECRNLEFDHLNEHEQLEAFGVVYGPKIRGVGQINSYAGQKLESRKCQLRCIFCHRRRTQQNYAKRPGAYKRRKTRQKLKLEYVKEKKIEIGFCASCKCPVDPTNLCYYEFDHIDPKQKRFPIANIAQVGAQKFTMEFLKEEMAMCQLLCSFCHRVRSRNQILEQHANNREEKRKKAKI